MSDPLKDFRAALDQIEVANPFESLKLADSLQAITKRMADQSEAVARDVVTSTMAPIDELLRRQEAELAALTEPIKNLQIQWQDELHSIASPVQEMLQQYNQQFEAISRQYEQIERVNQQLQEKLEKLGMQQGVAGAASVQEVLGVINTPTEATEPARDLADEDSMEGPRQTDVQDS